MTTVETQLVGSWCKPHWVADHERVYGPEGTWWRVGDEHRDEALDDCVRLAVYDQERAGLTYVTDGEQRRQTFSGHFYTLGGIDVDHREESTAGGIDILDAITMKSRPLATVSAPVSAEAPAPRPRITQPTVTGPITWTGPILADEVAFVRAHTNRKVKVTVIGPVTLAFRLVDHHYGSFAGLANGVAEALNAELRHLESLGVDLIQIDEPEVHFRYSACADMAVEAIDRALRGITTKTAIHMCYGYSKNIAEKRTSAVYGDALALLAATTTNAISLEFEQPGHDVGLLDRSADKQLILGVLNLDTEAPVETVEHIVGRSRDAAEVVGLDRLTLAPDCGMWFLPRETALGKITNMARAAAALSD